MHNEILPVLEIFSSIQGEGHHMGRAATFIRLFGCNLDCPWCDTKESWNPDANIKEMHIEEIVKECKDVLVIITGGEPCIHEALELLAYTLQVDGHCVAIETNGTLSVPQNLNWVTVAPKPGNDYKIHPECRYNELKFVVTDELDFDKHVVPYLEKLVPVWLQPNGYDMQRSAKRAYDFVTGNKRYNTVKLGVQMHKIYDFR